MGRWMDRWTSPLPEQAGRGGQTDRCALLANKAASGDANKPIKGVCQGRPQTDRECCWFYLRCCFWAGRALSSCSLIRKGFKEVCTGWPHL